MSITKANNDRNVETLKSILGENLTHIEPIKGGRYFAELADTPDDKALTKINKKFDVVAFSKKGVPFELCTPTLTLRPTEIVPKSLLALRQD